MDIKEALEKIKETCTHLIGDINGLVLFINSSEGEIDKMVDAKANIKKSIEDLQSELSIAKEKHLGQINALSENLESARRSSKESLKSLKEQFNKEYEDAKTDCHAKIGDLKVKVDELKTITNGLTTEIAEKQKLLASLNQAIDNIKTRLTGN